MWIRINDADPDPSSKKNQSKSWETHLKIGKNNSNIILFNSNIFLRKVNMFQKNTCYALYELIIYVR